MFPDSRRRIDIGKGKVKIGVSTIYQVRELQKKLQEMGRKLNVKWFASIVLYYRIYLVEIVLAAFFFQVLGLVIPLCTQVILDKVIVNKGMVTLDALTIGMVCVVVFQGIMDSVRRYLFSHTTNKIDVIFGTLIWVVSGLSGMNIRNVLRKDYNKYFPDTFQIRGIN